MSFAGVLHRSRLLMVLVILAVFGLSACGNGTTIKPKRDTGTEANNDDPDVGSNNGDPGTTPDAGNNGDTGGGGDANNNEDGDNNNPCLQTTAEQAGKFATDYAEALCAKMLSCERNSLITMEALLRGWTDQASCVEGVLAMNMSSGQAKDAVNSKTMKLNSCKAETCLTEIAELDCSSADDPIRENFAQGISSCYDALVGKVATGKACTINGQCGTNEFCQPDDTKDVCGGTCQDWGLVGSGQCGDIICRGDQYCTPENNVCVSRLANGEACDEDYECAYDSECVGDVCVEIDSGLDEGAECDSTNALCKIGLMCLNDECVVPGAVGDACQFVGCGAGLFCSADEECVERGDAGDACGQNDHCKSLSCVEGECTDGNALCP